MMNSMRAARRIALVIGNSNYRTANKLPNACRDADLIATKLGGGDGEKGLGFRVFKALDADFAAMMNAYENFIDAIDEARRQSRIVHAVIFYAGHGVQIADENCLIPIDANFEGKDAPPPQLFKLKDRLIHVAEKVGSTGIVVALFDACREKPFEKVPGAPGAPPPAYPVTGAVRGFSMPSMPAARDDASTFIAFATAPGEFAYDGAGNIQHSPFTQAVCAHISDTGLEIREFWNRVQYDVRMRVSETARLTGGGEQQIPWSESNLSDHFFFRPRVWTPVWAMIALGWLAGVAICHLLFDGDLALKSTSDQPWLYATSFIFPLVVAFAVWKWGSRNRWHIGFAFFGTALSFKLALDVLQNRTVLDFIAGVKKPQLAEVQREIATVDWFDLGWAALAGLMVVMIRILQINRPTGIWRRYVVPVLSGVATVAALWVVDRFLALHDRQEIIVFAMLSLFSGAILGLGATLSCRPQGDIFKGFGPITGGIAAGMTMPGFFVIYAMRPSFVSLMAIAPLFFALLGLQLGWCFSYYVREHERVRVKPPVRIPQVEVDDLLDGIAQPAPPDVQPARPQRRVAGADHAEASPAKPLPYPEAAFPLRPAIPFLPTAIRKIIADPLTETSVDSRSSVAFEKLGQSPWSAICRIHARYERSNETFLASGCITRDAVVLTAAHVLHHPSLGPAVTIEVWPGYHKDRAPLPIFTLTRHDCRVCQAWTAGWFVQNDYGVVRLPRGTDVSVFGPPAMLQLKEEVWDQLAKRRDATCCVVGYPGDRVESGCQWQGNGRIVAHDANVVAHLCDTQEGQSGAPLMITSSGRNYVVAVHSKGFTSTNNVARKINGQLMAEYQNWIT